MNTTPSPTQILAMLAGMGVDTADLPQQLMAAQDAAGAKDGDYLYFGPHVDDGAWCAYEAERRHLLRSYVRISSSDWSRLVEEANGNGKIIGGNSDGYPVLENPPPPTEEELRQTEMAELQQKLADTDYIAAKIAEGAATREEYADVLADRAAWRVRINELAG